MAANSTISVTELDFDDIKSSLKTYLGQQPEFLDYNFEGSAISLLVDLLAYNTYQNAFYTSMVGNEMFLDSAQLRDSVVSRAKMLGYTPRSARGANTQFSITVTPNDSPDSVTIAKNTEWSATVDGETLKFVTPQTFILTSDSGYSGNITVVEGQPLTHRFTISNIDSDKFILENENIDTTSITVDIEESVSDSTSVRYNLANDITTVQANSAVFFLQETTDQYYEIYFGDDVIGKKPSNGNVVVVNYRVCSGTVGNDISSFSDPSTVGGYSNFSKTVSSSSSGGAYAESITSIKFNAPKNYETQNRAVLANDYKRIILRDNGDIESVNIWGGEENTPPIYGKVYVAAKPTNGTTISSTRKDQIKTQLKKYNILSIDIEFVDAGYLYIVPTVIARYDSTLTTLSAGAIRTKIANSITSFETNNLGTFEKNKFRYSRFIRSIDDSDTSVVDNNTSIKMERRFNPNRSVASTYNISFSNGIEEPISAGHITHAGGHSITSSAFTYLNQRSFLDDDGEGIIRIYYISGTNTVVYTNENAGTVNYNTGLVTLNAFAPTAYEGSYLSIFAKPKENDIIAVRNQILLISGATVRVIDDATSLVAATTITATTTGVTTTVIDPGLYPIVY